MDREAFSDQVRDALTHLRSRFHLARHPLAASLGGEGPPITGEALRDLLLDGIEELRPTGGGVSETADWRRHRHLVLRYEQGQSLEQVAHALGVSIRQATRDHHQAVEDLVDILWTRVQVSQPLRVGASPDEFAARCDDVVRADLSGEIAKVASKGESLTHLAETVEGVLDTLGNLAEQRGVTFRPLVADSLPPVAVSRTLLRQAILNLLVYATEVVPGCQVLLAGTDTARGVTLRGVVQGARGAEGRLPEPLPPSQEAAELLVTARRLLEAQAGSVELGPAEPGQLLFAIVLPPVQLRTLLVVDDNPDLVGLFRRYLHDQPYRVIQATSGGAALGLSRQLRPGVILLDVLMPSQDGWEILQQLRSHAETRDIPVVICSVLPERTLARSLGVHEFLPKPFTRQDLMAVLERSYPTAAEPRARP